MRTCHTPHRREWFVLCAVGLVMLFPGCGSEKTYPVKGKVMLADGRPVTAGQIEFRANDRPISAIGYVQADGTFELSLQRSGDGTVAGTYSVALVEPPHPLGATGQGDRESQAARALSQWLADVPAKFRSMKTSGLTFEVKPDARANDFRIVLEP